MLFNAKCILYETHQRTERSSSSISSSLLPPQAFPNRFAPGLGFNELYYSDFNLLFAQAQVVASVFRCLVLNNYIVTVKLTYLHNVDTVELSYPDIGGWYRRETVEVTLTQNKIISF